MNEQTVVEIATKTIWLALQVASPLLIAAIVTGLIISVFQAATQINEQTLTFIPKIVAMMVAFIICGPWIIQLITNFTISLYNEIPIIGH